MIICFILSIMVYILYSLLLGSWSSTTTLNLGAFETTQITSPSYPSYYANNLNISWVIRTEECWRIHVIALAFATEYSDDVLRGGDGTDSADGSSVIFELSGSGVGPDALSNGSAMWLRFTTNGGRTYSGFSLWASSVPSTSKACPFLKTPLFTDVLFRLYLNSRLLDAILSALHTLYCLSLFGRFLLLEAGWPVWFATHS